jgi:hypothetical protein
MKATGKVREGRVGNANLPRKRAYNQEAERRIIIIAVMVAFAL